MALKSFENEKTQKIISLLEIGVGISKIKTIEERAEILSLIHESQLHIDWKATTAATQRKGELGKKLRTARDFSQDMQNLITRPLTEGERDDLRKGIEEASPGSVDRVMAANKGLVVDVRYKKKYSGGRENKKIYVYRFIPEKIYKSLGFKQSLPTGSLLLPQQLLYDRKYIHKFRQEIRRAFGEQPGLIKTCAYCGEPFLSERKQKGKYVCSKSRCRKAKTRKIKSSSHQHIV